jgi:hypothetical protein
MPSELLAGSSGASFLGTPENSASRLLSTRPSKDITTKSSAHLLYLSIVVALPLLTGMRILPTIAMVPRPGALHMCTSHAVVRISGSMTWDILPPDHHKSSLFILSRDQYLQPSVNIMPLRSSRCISEPSSKHAYQTHHRNRERTSQICRSPI